MATAPLDYYHHHCECGFDGYMLRPEQAFFLVARCPGCGEAYLWQWEGIGLPPLGVRVDDARAALQGVSGLDDRLIALLGLGPEGESK